MASTKTTLNFTTIYKPLDAEHTFDNVRVVDLRSDTVSKPIDGMRKAMFEAEVGDDVLGEDPTVNALEERAAKIFGKEASIFVPSGTMGNLIAAMAHCDRRGCDIVVGDKSHMLMWEQSGVAQIGGIQMTTVANLPDGTFCLDEMISKVQDGSNIHNSKTSLICVENTHNWCGGVALPLSWMNQLAELAREWGIPLHMDGARVFNAALCSGLSVAELVKDYSSVSVCLSKSLGAPVGSILVGNQQFIDQARRLRKVLGGGWRQAGIIAAGGLYALDHMVDRLSVDHARTRRVAEAIAATKTQLISIDLDRIQSNIFFMKFNSPRLTAHQFSSRIFKVTEDELNDLGEDMACIIKVFTFSNIEVRIVLCCNISDQDVTSVIAKLQYVINEFETIAD